MRHPCVVLFGGIVIAMTAASASTMSQSRTAGSSYTPPRTVWGDPDLQGLWRDLTPVPLERPKAFAGREFLTEAEVVARERQAEERRAYAVAGTAERQGEGNLPLYNAVFWFSEDRIRISRRTSAIIDPPDGQVPPWTLAQVQLWEAREKATQGRGDADSWEDRSFEERCIHVVGAGKLGNYGLGSGGSQGGGSSAPARSDVLSDAFLSLNAAHRPVKRIIQAPGYIVMILEEDDAYQIVPLDRPKLGSGIKQWLGVARGHWDGDTLVVEISNINGRQNGGPIIQVDQGSFYPGSGDTLKVVERYTRIAPDTLEYRATIEDSAVYVRPYTVLNEWTRDDKYKVSATICHEGHDDMASILASGRADEENALENAADAARDRLARFEQLRADAEKASRSR